MDLVYRIFKASAWGFIMPVACSILSHIPRVLIPLSIKIVAAAFLYILPVVICSWRNEDGTNECIWVPLLAIIIPGGFIVLFAYTPSVNYTILTPFDAMLFSGLIAWSALFINPARRGFLCQKHISGNLLGCTI